MAKFNGDINTDIIRKLSEKEKIEQEDAISSEIQNAFSKAMCIGISKAVSSGMDIVYEKLYDEYIQEMDTYEVFSDEWERMVSALLSHIRVRYLSILKQKSGKED